jgi:long-chain acyl-CoA synthetase
LSILAAGGVVVPIDSLLKEEELKRVLTESGMEKVIVSDNFAARADKVTGLLDKEIEIINLEGLPSVNSQDFELNCAEDPHSPAVLIFTSGTTGNSKKVILTHDNILSDIEGVEKRVQFGPGDRFLSVLPLHHTFEATCGFILPLTQGCAVYYIKALNSREIHSGMTKHRITIFIGVPLLFEKIYDGIRNGVKKAPFVKRIMFRALLAATKTVYSLTGKNVGKSLFASFRKKAGLGSLQLMVSGSAPLSVEIAKSFDFLGFNFIEGYGLTESSPVLSINPIGKAKYGSVGTPLENVEMKIDNPDENGAGEILARGPMITPGYQDNPEETARLLKDGWLHTGDLGCFDDDGYLYIKGRSKNLIVSAAGKNIYPEEIEAELLVSPFILEAMVYGKKSDSGREEVSVLIFPNFDALAVKLEKSVDNISDEEIKSALDPEVKTACEALADFKRIKHITYSRKELEKTSTKKVKRYLYK